jgi:hypothetical protein
MFLRLSLHASYHNVISFALRCTTNLGVGEIAYTRFAGVLIFVNINMLLQNIKLLHPALIKPYLLLRIKSGEDPL